MISNRTTSKSGKTSSQGRFATVPSVERPRSTFDRSCGRTTSFNEGDIIPILVDEALPGDTLNLKMTSFARMLTTVFPVMDNMYMDFFFFAVPNRLLWINWQKFMGEQTNPGDSTDFLVPQIDDIFVRGSMSDHFGIPTETGGNLQVNCLHHRAYNLIYNEFFRDQNLQTSLFIEKGDGPDNMLDYVIKKRNKAHDYFSSCLPFAQKGDAISIPLAGDAPLEWVDSDPFTITNGGVITMKAGGGDTKVLNVDQDSSIVSVDSDWGTSGNLGWNSTGMKVDLDGAGGTADLSQASSATINELRLSFQLQKMLERDARGGSRYTEILRSHFGVVSPDQRLQRPEYLGGGTTRIMINPIASATHVAGERDVGDLAAFATQASDGIGFVKSFVEHCVILGFVNVRAELTYQQGLNRMWSRRTRPDFYFPALAHIGEQAVLSKELFADGSAGDDDVFGYQERWAEYRYKPSEVTGDMRSNSPSSLDPWHLALDFDTRPLLNSTFIEDNAPIARVVSVPSVDHFKADFWFDMKVARCMPTNSVPGMIDHF